ncbi:MAG: zinc dependent phospholipase C family protein [Lachnospiraceae bacterium]|nr:zinc dependent phospholipase C family protein [Lachnospiraceae bacterium]
MPTTYTHIRFGKEVYRRLPQTTRHIIAENQALFLTGLQGPDLFFYCNPLSFNRVVKLGHQMHENLASDFFDHAAKVYQKQPSQQMLSYLLGFGCHYLLDSTCHGYINAYAAGHRTSHACQETELDRSYLLKDKKRPLGYPRAAGILKGEEVEVEIIHRLFKQVSMKDLRKTLKGLHLYTGLLNTKHRLLNDAFAAGMKLLQMDKSIADQLMRPRPVEEAAIPVANLMALYQKALQEAPESLRNLQQYLMGELPQLSSRYHHNFC